MKEQIKKFRAFLKEDTPLSWIVNVILAFLIVRYLIYPILGILLSTSHPLVAVVSGSMEHDGLNFEEYWEIYGDIYEDNYYIEKEEFLDYSFKNGFNKGDIMVLRGKDEYKRGDVIVYSIPNYNYPIIHRVIKRRKKNNEMCYTTKGDHNTREDNLCIPNPIGKAVLRIPKLGYIKIIAVDYIWKPIFGG